MYRCTCASRAEVLPCDVELGRWWLLCRLVITMPLRTGPWRSSEHFIECEEAEEDHSSQKRHVEEIIVVVDRLG